MTKANVFLLNDGFLLECDGHAGTESDADAVCAGVSALCMALDATLEEMAEEGRAEDVRRNAADGYYAAEAHYDAKDCYSAVRLDTVLRTVTAGLTEIEQRYPKHMQVDFN